MVKIIDDWDELDHELEPAVHTFEELGKIMGELLEKKNKAYGTSFSDAPKFLEILYPNGVQPNQYLDMLLLVRIFDKIKRISVNNDPFGENPYQDIAGYGILGMYVYEIMQHEIMQAGPDFNKKEENDVPL